MANLLDTIRQAQSAGATGQPVVADETQRIQQLMRAKSGKSIGSTAPQSAVSEQAAAQATAAGQQQLGQQIGVSQLAQRQEQVGLESQLGAQEQQIQQSRRAEALETRINTERVLNDLERNKGQIDQQREQAALEQAAIGLRMQNTKYIDELQREGQKARLDNQLEFQEELTRSVFSDNNDLLKQQLDNKSVLDVSDREFKKMLTQLDADTAWRIYQNEVDSSKRRGMWEALGTATQAGIGFMGSDSGQSAGTSQYGTQADATRSTGVIPR